MIKFENDAMCKTPFADTLNYYKNIVEFFEHSKEILDKFTGAIPNDNDEHKIYFWNDTGANPALRFELIVVREHVPGQSCNVCISYKVTKVKDKFKYIVDVEGTKYKFEDETKALACVTECYHAIRNYTTLP